MHGKFQADVYGLNCWGMGEAHVDSGAGVRARAFFICPKNQMIPHLAADIAQGKLLQRERVKASDKRQARLTGNLNGFASRTVPEAF